MMQDLVLAINDQRYEFKYDQTYDPGKYFFIQPLFVQWRDTIYQPLRSGRIWHKVNFYAEFNRFEFRVFLLLD